MPAHRDAVMVLSFGGPEGPDDVMPFLRNVTKGRNVPDERLAVVASQYAQFGGRSPINDHNRELVSALESELGRSGSPLPVYWGNRNWDPYVNDAVQQMADDGVTQAWVFATSIFGSYSGCRQYSEDLERAAKAVGAKAPRLTKLRLFYNHPGFIESMADRLDTRLSAAGVSPSQLSAGGDTRLLFTAHSLPESMAASCNYVDQLHEAASLVVAGFGLTSNDFDVVYQSRSGPPTIPWLEPDINDHLADIASSTPTKGVVVAPIGFVSDHAEVLFDIETQARATATDLGLDFWRVPTVGNHPRFVTMISELIGEQRSGGPRLALGSDGPWPDQCAPGHCQAATRPHTAGASLDAD